MTQPVTTHDCFELASELEELSGLALRIVRNSDELRASLKSHPPTHSASARALLRVALSNVQGCLSLLQSMTRAPIHSPYVYPPSSCYLCNVISCSPSPPSEPPVTGPPHPTTPVHTATGTFFFLHGSRPLTIMYDRYCPPSRDVTGHLIPFAVQCTCHPKVAHSIHPSPTHQGHL